MANIKRFILQRVGAGPGNAIFACQELLGDHVEAVDAAQYATLDTLANAVAFSNPDTNKHDRAMGALRLYLRENQIKE